ncbi:hypothetical protein ABOM_009683 [Aspergillus bombycis]|uniref:Uncharacterized protein n=1 Tax=Aspergillus bombycis TaxID=109264 RepID=A0A1F7ZSI7_9EURO|nr:hypothetical protein ABOM_009683 [Aspergillus bombycis]OGM42035.1 hypothetical protein ABOM_009683 [Aspergillus bombycis]
MLPTSDPLFHQLQKLAEPRAAAQNQTRVSPPSPYTRINTPDFVRAENEMSRKMLMITMNACPGSLALEMAAVTTTPSLPSMSTHRSTCEGRQPRNHTICGRSMARQQPYDTFLATKFYDNDDDAVPSTATSLDQVNKHGDVYYYCP